MSERMDFSAFPKPAMRAMLDMEAFLGRTRLGGALLALLKLRASQINGCAYCIDMHYKEARAAGESEQRLYGLVAWHDSPYYTPQERAALRWTEAVTRLGQDGVSDAVWEEALAHFSKEAVAELTIAALAINAWNRWNVAMRTKAGDYAPQTNETAD